MRSKKTWFLLANSQTARVLESRGPGKGLHQVSGESRSEEDDAPHRDQMGRAFASHGTMSHSMEPHNDGNMPDEFLCGVMGKLADSHSEQEFDRLVICAAPATLAALRRLTPSALKSDILAEIDKDLTNLPLNKLASHFDDVVVV